MNWWLPADYSRHGPAIDFLFNTIAALTGAILVAFCIVLIFILIRFRHRPGISKARFIRGNGKLEIVWTTIPIIILLSLAVWSQRVWAAYRNSPDLHDPSAAHVLVIARRFNWNVIYSGADGKLGQYLQFPHMDDPFWPKDERSRPVAFRSTTGPSSVPPDQTRKMISLYTQEGKTDSHGPNEFGKVFDPAIDPEGVDDVINNPTGRLDLPVNRPTVIEVTSLDVIHDFFLPNFRINVYAVPGMRIRVALTPTMTSKQRERESAGLYDLDSLPSLLADKKYAELSLEIDENSPGETAAKDHDRTGWRYVSVNASGQKTTIIRDGQGFPADAKLAAARIEQLKAIGLKQVRAHLPGYWEIVCAQLCGDLHSSMEGRIYVLDQGEWAAKYERKSR